MKKFTIAGFVSSIIVIVFGLWVVVSIITEKSDINSSMLPAAIAVTVFGLITAIICFKKIIAK